MHRDVIHKHNDIILQINMSFCMKIADCNKTENICTTKYVYSILINIASKEHLQPRSQW
jgi:hypothetical protein